MHSRRMLLVVLWIVAGCGPRGAKPGADDASTASGSTRVDRRGDVPTEAGATPPSDVPPQAADAPAAAAGPDAPDGDGAAPADCAALVAAYLAERDKLNSCQSDNDCAELWPGVCPHGAHYLRRDSDLAPLRAAIDRLTTGCTVPVCEPPAHLGPATCRDGRCVEGRASPTLARSDCPECCWDYRETYIEDGGAASGETREHLQGIAPLWAYGASAAGTLFIDVEWTGGCTDCALLVSEHNSGMANPVEGQRAAMETGLRVSAPVTPGLYYFFAQSPGGAHPFVLRTHLVREDGRPAEATHHGVSWQRMCED